MEKSGRIAAPQKIVGGNAVIIRQLQQVPQRQFVGAPLVAGVHGLGCAEDIGDVLLRFVVILPQIPQPPLIGESPYCTTPLAVL